MVTLERDPEEMFLCEGGPVPNEQAWRKRPQHSCLHVFHQGFCWISELARDGRWDGLVVLVGTRRWTLNMRFPGPLVLEVSWAL